MKKWEPKFILELRPTALSVRVLRQTTIYYLGIEHMIIVPVLLEPIFTVDKDEPNRDHAAPVREQLIKIVLLHVTCRS